MAENNRNEQLVGEGVRFERIRRITGYLVGGMDRFNNAKRAEVGDRVKHGLSFSASNSDSIGARDRPLGSQHVYTRLHDLEAQFSMPDTHRMIYQRYLGDFTSKPEFSASDIRKRIDVLEYLEQHHNDMTDQSIEFWLDTIRFDGEPDLDKEPSPDKYKSPMKEQLEAAAAQAELFQREEQARQEPGRKQPEQNREQEH